MNQAVCICTMANVYDEYVKNMPTQLSSIKNLHILVDATKAPDHSKGFSYTEQQVRELLNFKLEVSKRHYWNSYGNRNIIWFYAHFRMLMFYIKNPNFEYYWFFDDDVHMNDWNMFFEGFGQDTNTDFFSYFVFKKPGVISQPKIPVMDNRTTSQHMWFERFPGNGDVLPKEITEYFGSFFPVVRYSNRAMAKLLELTLSGYTGYGEGFVPTTLNLNKMNLGTIIRNDDKSDYFDTDKVNIIHKGTKVNWSWI